MTNISITNESTNKEYISRFQPMFQFINANEDIKKFNKVNKTQIVNLIKSGCFDRVENKSRQEILDDYVISISDIKSKLTLQNMPSLIREGLIPDEVEDYARLFNFNKYLKKLLDNYGFHEREKNTDPEPMTYLYIYDMNFTRFEISEKGEYDDEIIVNILFSGISSDGSVYTIVANDTSYDGDNIEDFKADLDQVFNVK